MSTLNVISYRVIERYEIVSLELACLLIYAFPECLCSYSNNPILSAVIQPAKRFIFVEAHFRQMQEFSQNSTSFTILRSDDYTLFVDI